MFSQHSKTTDTDHDAKLRLRDLVGDFIGAIALFGTGYLALLIGYGFGAY